MGLLQPWHFLILLLVVVLGGGVLLAVVLSRKRPPGPVAPPPGFYPDPENPARDRFFDGRGWTPQTRARTGPAGPLR